MEKLVSQISTESEEYRQNYTHNSKTVDGLRDLIQHACFPKADSAIQKHQERGKLLARERVDLLCDSGSAFLELSCLAGLDVYEGVRPGAGIITGIGRVSGREVMIVANDATVKGGTYFPLTVKKHLRAQEIALENQLPCVYLVDSGGAFLPLQDQVFPDRDHFGRIFYNQATMSAAGIPQIAVVMGACTAGGAYVPAMSDQAIMVRQQGTIFLGGPPLVKAATGEEVSAEELGGAEVHCKISGVADYLADSDAEALKIARSIVGQLGQKNSQRLPLDRISPAAPLYPPDEILGLIPADPKKYFPMREILARLLDRSEIDEFKKHYGTTIICGFARLDGILVGVIANDGILFSESALKAAHFIELCSQRMIPLLFCQNIAGFMVGKKYEHGGIAKDGAKMVTAVACAPVPKITLVMGGSFGAGNYGMAGRAFQPSFMFMWPNARISVMGPQQAASVLTQVKRDGLQSQNRDWPKKAQEEYYQEIVTTYEKQSSAYYASARLWDDGIISPEQTRRVLGLAFACCSKKISPSNAFGVFRF